MSSLLPGGDGVPLDDCFRDLTTLALARLTAEGAVTAANKGFLLLANHPPGPEGPWPGAELFVQPTFEKLRERTSAPPGAALYRGVLYLGPVGAVRPLKGTVYRTADGFLLVAEIEAAERDRWRKDEFLAVLGHELRNPLAPIRNALQVLHLRGADAGTRAWAEGVVERQVQTLGRLVDDLLDVTRIGRRKVQLRRERLDLTQLVRNTTDDYRGALEAAGLTLTVELPAAPAWVLGDAVRLTQVLGNLLSNAAKFTDAGGRVRVRLALEAAGQASVAVQDTGIGIAPEMLPYVFESFAQADQSLERNRGGLGLGLALVKGLVELHGGRVEAASAGPGQGAEFTFWVPLEQAPSPRPAPPPALAAAARERILLVEDNLDSAETLRLLLELKGHQVAMAHTGPAALEAARDFHPDVVLCDLGLPGMDGFAVAAALRADPATAGVHLLALSGYGSDSDQRRCQEVGFDRLLIKPVDLEELQRVLANRK